MQDVERYAQFCVFVNIFEALKAYYVLCKYTNTYSERSTTKEGPLYSGYWAARCAAGVLVFTACIPWQWPDSVAA